MTRKEILEAAAKCVNGDRDQQYGRPENSFSTIANLWETYLHATGHDGAKIEPADVAAMLALLKIARIATGVQKADNWVDLAGYAACGGELESDEIEQNSGIILHKGDILPKWNIPIKQEF